MTYSIKDLLTSEAIALALLIGPLQIVGQYVGLAARSTSLSEKYLSPRRVSSSSRSQHCSACRCSTAGCAETGTAIISAVQRPGLSHGILASRRRRRAVIIGGSMSGLFTAAFLRRIGWDVDVFERSPVELVGRGAGITTHPELLEALEASGAGTRDLGIEVTKRITIDRAGPRHRRAAVAANPDLLGPPATTAARDHRSRALPPRPHLRARRAGRTAGCASISPRAASNAPTCWWAATASAPACARRSRRKCSRSIRAITSGAARRTRPTSRRRRSRASFPISFSSCPSASR